MKPADQLKVVALAFFSIIVMIGIITTVSLMTTSAVAGHGGGHGTESHATTGGEHGTPAASSAESHSASQASDAHGEAKPADHSADAKSTEHDSQTKAGEHGADAKSTEHAGEAKPADHAADKGTEAKSVPANGGNIEAGGKVFMTKTCSTCHTATVVKAAGTIGPKLDGLGATAAKRVAGTSAEDYIKQSIEDPNAFVVEGYAKGLMPQLRSTLNDQEFKDLVAFLGSL